MPRSREQRLSRNTKTPHQRNNRSGNRERNGQPLADHQPEEHADASSSKMQRETAPPRRRFVAFGESSP
jgi:hypothetical protein